MISMWVDYVQEILFSRHFKINFSLHLHCKIKYNWPSKNQELITVLTVNFIDAPYPSFGSTIVEKHLHN